MWPDVKRCHINVTIRLDALRQVEAESCPAESCPVNMRRNREGEANPDGGGGGVCVW
jgi:hypothetical protein